MAIFEFELASVEDILPWGEPGEQSLSWFALTDGRFRVIVGDQILFRYSDEILSHRGSLERDAEYQVAAFVRSILSCVAAAVAPLPPRIERLASNWQLLMELEKPLDDVRAVDDLWYDAWGWLGERSPSTSYLVGCPKFQFVRIHWDNRGRSIDGLPVWTARQGVRVMSVEAFLEECRDLVRRLLSAMHERIAGIEVGAMKPQVEVSTSSLHEQHEMWRAEFASYFGEYQPDVPWQETENTLLAIAQKKGLRF
ncbi:MAG: hypothetical protein C0485_12950 [Pirellula sp.]|nr:hypothetical protein [Pirellula sp.]